MKTKIFLYITCFLLICLPLGNLQYAQNITNTLGTLGVFKIKDGSTDYLTLNQSTGQVNILKTLQLENTNGSTAGVIYKGTNRFIHNYGLNNTFMGVNSGNFTMTGMNNTVVGISSLFFNTNGVQNATLGMQSLYSNTTGFNNAAVGYQSLYTNTNGSQNIAVGYQSLYFNTDGYSNTGLGYRSLYSNTTGYDNTAVGIQSLFSNTVGFYNTGLGYESLYMNTTGDYNTALGISSLYFNTTGNYNTALGYYSLNSNTTGSNNTAIGYNAQVPSVTASNQVRIGNALISYAGIQVAWTITSDRRWKQNILPVGLGLGFISRLNPVSYTRINDESGKTEYGLIAQEVEEVLKESGAENSGMLTVTDEGMYELRYNDLLAPMVKAIQELSEGLHAEKTENDEIRVESEKLKVESVELKNVNEELKQRLLILEQTQNILVSEIEKLKAKEEMPKQVQHDEETKLSEK